MSVITARSRIPFITGLIAGAVALSLMWQALHHQSSQPAMAVYREATSENDLRTMALDPVMVANGRALFLGNCTLCHGTSGQGASSQGIGGPNLRDEYWLKGSDLTNICESIANGNLQKGMAEWKRVLKPDDFHALAAFIASLQGSEDGSGKAPEGVAQPMTWRKSPAKAAPK
jgi:cbb3-type cytochrome c oxidase subunit III